MSYGLPLEIWMEIFHRQPLKSLVRCMCVCKAWKSLITNKSFIYSHLSYSAQAENGNDSLFLQFHHSKELTPWFNHSEEFYSFYSDNQLAGRLSIFKFPLKIHQFGSHLTVIGTCNGLVCFAEYSTSLNYINNIIIMNPYIRKYIVVPKSTNPYGMRYYLLGFGFDSKKKDFKVVRIVACYPEPWEPLPPQVEVYCLVTRKWRNISDRAPSFYYYSHGKSDRHNQVLVNGVLHWIVCENCNGRRRYFILTFDLVEETFGELMLPQSLDFNSSCELYLLGGSNSLALVYKSNFNAFDIWVMKEYGALNLWNLESFSFDSTDYGSIETVRARRSSGELVLQRYNGDIILLDPKKDSVKCLGLEQCAIDFVGHYVENLFLMDKVTFSF